jgi:hypothetical protein
VNKIIKSVKTDDILLSLTNALDMRLPRANPDVCAGASVGAGGCCGDKELKVGIKIIYLLL